jgi:hypothetical protein
MPERMRMSLKELASNGMMSMLGLFVAWQVFPFVTDPLFSLLLRLIHPSLSYS